MILFDRIAAGVVALCLCVLLLASALALTTRTTPAGPGMVYRENLLTGSVQACGPQRAGPPACYAVQQARPLADFSARAVPGQ